jgi:hypothetical protein
LHHIFVVSTIHKQQGQAGCITAARTSQHTTLSVCSKNKEQGVGRLTMCGLTLLQRKRLM